MRNREIYLWTIIIALIGGIILYISLNNNQTTINVKNTYQATTTDNTIQKNTQNSTIKSYTASDLSKHNNQTSCWTSINGKIYDITGFLTSHPAGLSKILKGCGIDATNMYGRVGAHDVSRLSNTFVGNLK